jgi:hypothetical protein
MSRNFFRIAIGASKIKIRNCFLSLNNMVRLKL